MMNTDYIYIILSFIFIVVYILRYRNNLSKRLGFLAIGSFIIYMIIAKMLTAKFNLLYVSKSILLYILIDQAIFYLKNSKNKK